MADNQTDFNATQQFNQDWANLPQDFGSPAYGSYQPTFGATSSEYFLNEQSIVQQNATYNLTLNDYPLPNNPISQIYSNNIALNDAKLPTCLENSQDFNSYPQAFDSFAAFDMNTVNPNLDDLTLSTEPGGAETQLKCRFPDCSEEREFPTESALRKHQDKHSKPYVCGVPDCKHTQFGDKGGLVRHTREIHGTQTYRCPISSCKRHTKGFPRKYNLFEHQKRCHPSQSPSVSLRLTQTSRDLTHSHREGTEGVPDGDEEGSSPDVTDTGGGARTGIGRLQEELARLYELQVEIDSDIQVVKRALEIVGESSA